MNFTQRMKQLSDKLNETNEMETKPVSIGDKVPGGIYRTDVESNGKVIINMGKMSINITISNSVEPTDNVTQADRAAWDRFYKCNS